MENLYEKALESAEYIKAHTTKRPKVAVVLGSGLGNLTADFTDTEELPYCWVSVKQFSKNDTATACQDWLRSTRLGRGSIKSHVRTVKVLGMGLFAFQERIHLWKGVTH